MRQADEWARQAARLTATGEAPHFAPSPEEVAVHARHLAAALRGAGPLTVLVLGATPELADLVLAQGCRLIRVDASGAMLAAARGRERVRERSREMVVQGDWLDMQAIPDDGIDVVLGDAALNNVSHGDMPRLFAELRRVTRPGSTFSLKQIVLPDGDQEACDFNHAVRMYRSGGATPREFYLALRFCGFLSRAYEPESHTLNAEQVFAGIRERFRSGLLSATEFEFLYARRGRLRHTVYTQSRQREMFQDNLGDCRVVYPSTSPVYRSVFHLYRVRRGMIDENARAGERSHGSAKREQNQREP